MPPDNHEYAVALSKAIEAMSLANIAIQKITSLENEAGRRWSESTNAYESLRNQINDSNREMRQTVTEAIGSLQQALSNSNELTNKKVGGLYTILLGSSGALILALVAAILAYILHH